MEILYHDRELAVCVKPAGVLSEGSVADPRTAPGLLAQALAEEGSTPRTILPVHRLDRETRGIMVYALTESAAASLSRALTEGAIHKEYVALVHGAPTADEGEMRDLLYYDRARNKSFPVKRERKGVKHASLSYRVVARDPDTDISTVRVTLQTGRTHQIRVQFASRKMPLVGDRKYGAPATDGNHLALTSVLLSFPHPKTGERMTFEIEP